MGIMYIGITTFSITSYAEPATVVPDTSVVATVTPSVTPVVTEAPTPTPEPNSLKPADAEITELITKYLDAKLTCNEDDFKGLVSDTSLLDMEEFQRATETVKAYQNIECYTKKGTGIIDYVVYYTYETIIPTIDTPGVSIDYIYVTHNDKNKPVIFLGDLDADTYDYLGTLSLDDDVQQLTLSVVEKVTEAMEKDPDLKAFIEKLQGIPEGDSEG